MNPEKVGGWILYRKLENLDINKHAKSEHLIEINDLTDDFDFPIDYDMWLVKYNEFKILGRLD